MKTNHKRLKVALVSKIRKLGPLFLASKLGEFPFFDDFFFDLANFRDLDNFWLFNLPAFGFKRFDLPLPSTSPTLLATSTLVPSTSLAASTYNEMVVFSIDVSGAAILLNP